MDETKRPTQYKRAREGAGLSLSQAWKLLGIPLRQLANIENGDLLPPVFVQQKMLEVYDVSYRYLTTGEPETLIDHIADGISEEALKAFIQSKADDENNS